MFTHVHAHAHAPTYAPTPTPTPTHLDGVLRQHAAVQLHGGQAEMLCDLAVLDLHHILHGLAADPLSDH